MTDKFEDAKLRCKQRKNHIIDLQQKILAFAETKPYSRSVEILNLNGLYEVVKTKISKPLPKDLKTVTADAVGNLRAALDLAVYPLVALRVGQRESRFPFVENAEALEKHRVFINLPDEMKPLFRGFKPYKGGNDFLWALNRICNTNKHRMLSALLVRGRSRNVFSTENFHVDSICSQNEVISAIERLDKTQHYDCEPEFAVTFAEVDIV